ncbi:hypothetical protein [Nocardia carnea]|uniref:hypothetical protein n=1 Tax=Nocardia carnea TaxID=37328 RepID=UPI002457A792|nr:hypothetical protein [Nocardia carnea]
MTVSRIQEVIDGELGWTEVDLLDIDDRSAELVRGSLEQFGIRVNYFSIGQSRHLIAALGGARPVAPYVIVCCHGSDGRILLQELGGPVADAQPFLDELRPEHVREYLRIPGSTVICTGCDTGGEALAQAFLDAGAARYFAPTDSPDGHSAFLAVLLLFYELTAGHEWDHAVDRVRGYDDELSMWKLWER